MPTISKILLKNLGPKRQVYDVRDDQVTGFMVRVSPKGNMSYAVQYARGKRLNLGNVNNFQSPNQARIKAQQVIAEFKMHKRDPIEAAKKEKGLAMTFAQFMEKEFRPHVATYHKGRPREAAQRIEKHFPGFTTKRLIDISTESILRWRREKLQEQDLQKNTINKLITYLRMFFKLAVELNYIHTNPCQTIKPFKHPDERTRYLSQHETEKLLVALSERDLKLKQNQNLAFGDHLKPAVLLALHAGLRKSELFNLKRSDVDFTTKIITVRNSKSRKQRNIPMNALALQTMKQWLQQTQELASDYVFPSHKNSKRPMQDTKKSWQTLLGKIPEIENFRWHDLRHDFASKLVMAGVDLNTVRELLGHADIKMTLRYAHLAPEHLQNSVAKLVS